MFSQLVAKTAFIVFRALIVSMVCSNLVSQIRSVIENSFIDNSLHRVQNNLRSLFGLPEITFVCIFSSIYCIYTIYPCPQLIKNNTKTT